MRRITRARLAGIGIALALVEGACGGGSGAGAGANLDVTPASLSFTALQGRAPPPAQTCQVTFSSPEAVYVGAAFAGSAPAWLPASGVTLTGASTSWTLRVQVGTTSLAPGTYSATLQVGIARADQSIITYRDVPITYTVSAALGASPAALAFKHVVGGPVPPAQPVAVSGAGLAWASAADKAWLQPAPASGTAPSTVQVGVDPSGLAPGTYSGAVGFSRAAGGDTVTVAVGLTVEAPAMAASKTSLSFSGVNGTALAAQAVDVSLTNAASATWTASADAGRVVLSAATGSTPGTLSVSVDPSVGPLASGTHQATITLAASSAGYALTKTIPVTLSLTKPTLTLAPAALTLGGATGRDPSAKDVALTLSTGAAAHPWAATPSDAWIALAATSGSASGAARAVAAGADPSGLAAGTYQGSVAFAATVNGDVVTATLPVTLLLDRHRLLASDDGVAFASLPGMSRLSRTLRVRDNFGAATTWTATPSATWLTAAPGTAAGELVLTADTTGLSADVLREASVAIAPDAAGVAGETIRVGLWIGAATTTMRSVAGAYEQVAMDPVRPFAYVHKGGTDIEVWNVFTGAAVGTFAKVAPVLGSLAVSTDGTRLFAEDETNHRIVPIALPGGTVGTAFTIGSPDTLVYARTNGKEIVFAGAGYAYDPDAGTRLDTTGVTMASAVVADAAVDGTRFCWASTGMSPHDVVCYPLDYTAATGKMIVGASKLGYAQGYGGDVALNADGTRVYHMAGGWDTTTDLGYLPQVQTLTPGGLAIEISRDGRIIFASSGLYTDTDVWVRDAAGYVLGQYKIAGYARSVVDAQLKVTGDGLGVAAITEDPKLVFLVIGP